MTFSVLFADNRRFTDDPALSATRNAIFVNRLSDVTLLASACGRSPGEGFP